MAERFAKNEATGATALNPITLATTVEGGNGLTTAHAARGNGNGNVRSRSRSPQPTPSSSSAALAKPEHHVPTRIPSIDRPSYLPSPSSVGSSTSLSSLAGISSPSSPLSGKTITRPTSLRARIAAAWDSNAGLAMVVLGVLFAALVGATIRLMETGPNPMHVFQILFARMAITATLCVLYMWWRQTPDAPLGSTGVRKLLMARGFGGLVGVTGFYYSLTYLPLGEVTVISFLVPMVTNGVCSVLLKEPFTRREQLAGVLSMVGIVFIARPISFWSAANDTDQIGNLVVGTGNSTMSEGTVAPELEVTPLQRLVAIGMALVGVCGNASAFITIRWIGTRAHPLISINYFSVWCTIVSLGALTFIPSIPFRLPASFREWSLLISMVIFGMTAQFLLTAGLSRQKGSAATNMTYTQMIFVLIIDYVVFGTVLSWASWVGVVLILGSQIWATVARGKALENTAYTEVDHEGSTMDEEVGLVGGQDENHEDYEITNIEMQEIRR